MINRNNDTFGKSWDILQIQKAVKSLKVTLASFDATTMKIFINNQKKTKIRKKRAQIDPSQVSEFLNRPVIKPQDLNQNLKKSYQKKFFKGPRFEHFTKLRNLRKGKETDSILSSDHQDEDYQHSQRKILKKEAKAIKQEQKSIKKEISCNFEYQRDEQLIVSSKVAKKMAKKPVKKETSSESKSSSSANSSESSNQSTKKAAQPSQISSKQTNPKQHHNESVTNVEPKSKIIIKQEPTAKVQVSTLKIQKNIPFKAVSKAKFERQSSCQLSDEPEPITDGLGRKVKFVDEISKNIDYKTKQKKSTLRHQQRLIYKTDLNTNQIKEQAKSSPKAVTHPITRASKLSINSRVIVESIYICANRSSNNHCIESAIQLRNKWQLLSSLFQHAPCCRHTHHQQNSNISIGPQVYRSLYEENQDVNIHSTEPEAKTQIAPIQNKEEKEKKRSHKRKSKKKEHKDQLNQVEK